MVWPINEGGSLCATILGGQTAASQSRLMVFKRRIAKSIAEMSPSSIPARLEIIESRAEISGV
jgi:hypothetical protein